MPELAAPGWLAALLGLPVLFALAARLGPRSAESRARRVAVGVLRSLAFVAVVIALSGPLKVLDSERTDIVFALDVSRSVDPSARREALDLVNRAIAEKDRRSRIGLVVFGANASVESFARSGVEPVAEVTADVEREGTDIGRAIEVAIGAMPAGGNRRVVLLSDGQENLGRARAAAAVARSLGVEVDTIALERSAVRDEVRLGRIVAPSSVRAHEPFAVTVAVHAARATRAHLVVMGNGARLEEVDLDLAPGENVYGFEQQLAAGGLHEYEAIVTSPADEVQENNRYQTFVRVSGPPRVLHAVGEPGWGGAVTRALRTQGLTVDEVAGTALPLSLHRLAEYDLVILDNVSGFDISLAKMERLEEYVRDGGGGLIVLGGDKSYSAGGYHGTPVERALPVTMDVPSEVHIPTLAVTVVMDRSGSMGSDQKLAIAKRAALSAIEVLNPLDRVGVLAFDDQPEWSVPLGEVGSRRAITDRLQGVGSGGGTNLYLALREAARVMDEQPAMTKHLIVLSDGLTDTEEDFAAVTEAIAARGITVSTVAFGTDADQALMESIAAWGKGRYYYTADPLNIPRIFAAETLVVARDLHVEAPTRAKLRFPGEIVEGFDEASFPVLDGFQRAFARPAAQVLLEAGEREPLLVAWRYGLGKSVAFLSDLDGRWGRRWVEWSQFPRFAGQLARWTMRRGEAVSLLPEFAWHGRDGEVTVDVIDPDGRFVNRLEMRGAVIGPDREASALALEQVAPGRYRGEFPVPRAGRYYVSLSDASGDARVGPRTFGLAVPYSPEYLGLGPDREHLRELAAMSGGRYLALSPESLQPILAPAGRGSEQPSRIWWPFVLAALLAVIAEVAVRKLTLPLAWRRVREPAAAAPSAGHATLVEALEAAREAHLRSLREGSEPIGGDHASRVRLHVGGRRRG